MIPGRCCAWCEADLSSPGTAQPILYAQEGLPEANWACLDEGGCNRRQDALMVAAAADTRFAVLFPPGFISFGPLAAITAGPPPAPEGWVRLTDVPWLDSLSPDDKIALVAMALEELGTAQGFALMHRPEQGERKYAAVSGHVRFDADGNLLLHLPTAQAGGRPR
jgi:hypothetical protein